MDEGFVALKGEADIATFLKACRAVRHWPREAKVHAV